MNSPQRSSFHPKTDILTKSRFLLGQRCHKALHFNTFSPELAKNDSKHALTLKREGIEVGKYVRSLYPEGILIDSEDIETAVKDTQKKIDNGTLTIFEAAFCFGNVVVRTDILTRQTVNDPWRLYEVKATTYNTDDKAKIENYRQDIAIQVWVLQNCGITIEGAYLMHLNSKCIYPNLDTLFVSVDYWEEISPILAEIPNDLEKLRLVIQEQNVIPNVSIGPHCEGSRDCSFSDVCWNHIPKPSIFNIPNCRKRWKFFEEGRIGIHQLFESDFKSAAQLRVLKCHQEEQLFFDKQTALNILGEWKYPLCYFDIEAIKYPIPRYPHSRPYQNLPFQFSCHIQRNKNSEIEHHEFLYEGIEDPRPAFIQTMLKVIPQNGSIVVYHKTFEIGSFSDLARDFPEYAQSINDLIPRVVDLKKVIMDTVYDPGFMGSYSIKKVAPALLGEQSSYDHLEVDEGTSAMFHYQQMINLDPKDPTKEKIRKDLIEYCKQDTLLMVHLHTWLWDRIT